MTDKPITMGLFLYINKNISKLLSLVVVVTLGYFVFLKKNEIIEVCIGNRDLPNLNHVKILKWSDIETWGGKLPSSGAHIVVPAGKTILLDVSPPELASLEINGVLVFGDVDIRLSTRTLLLTGVLQVGSPNKPYAHIASIILNGTESKFLLQGGRLALFGLKAEPNHREPADTIQNMWGFSQFRNISLKKIE